MLLLHGNPGFNFTCTSFIICYHATHLFEIFHMLRLLLIYHNLYWGWLPRDSHHLTFFHIHFHHSKNAVQNNKLKVMQFPRIYISSSFNGSSLLKECLLPYGSSTGRHLPFAETGTDSIMLPSDVTAPRVSASIQTHYTRELFR